MWTGFIQYTVQCGMCVCVCVCVCALFFRLLHATSYTALLTTHTNIIKETDYF